MISEQEAIEILEKYSKALDIKNKGQVSEKLPHEYANLSLDDIIEACKMGSNALAQMNEIRQHTSKDEKIKALSEILMRYNLPIRNVKMIDNNDFIEELISKPLCHIANDYVPIINCYREMIKVMYNIQDI